MTSQDYEKIKIVITADDESEQYIADQFAKILNYYDNIYNPFYLDPTFEGRTSDDYLNFLVDQSK